MLDSKLYAGAGLAGSIEEALMGAIQDPNVHVRLRAVADAARVLDPEMLIDAMADQNDAVRRNAAIEVLARGGPRSVPTLIRALRHSDAEVVMFAAGVLGRTRDPSAVPHLIALLDHEDINIAQGAIESLARLRAAPSVEPLIEALDKDPWLRFAAVHALGEIGDARAVSPLVGLLDDDSIAEAAIAALGHIGTVEALSPLAERLSRASDDETFVACLRAIGDALEQQPDDRALERVPGWKWLGSAAAKDVHLRLLEVLSTEETGLIPSSDSLILQCAAAYLVRALRLQPLYGALVRAGREPLLRDALQFCILSIGVEIATALAGNIANADANVRLLACRCAGALALPKLAPLVEKLLEDEREAVRAVAVQALARIAREAALSAIVPMLADPSEEVRTAAASALHAMNAEDTTRALVAQPPRELQARLLAADIMRANPHAAQRPMLLAYLSDAHPAVRRAAIAALARQAGADLVHEIGPLLRGGHLVERRRAGDGARQTREP